MMKAMMGRKRMRKKKKKKLGMVQIE